MIRAATHLHGMAALLLLCGLGEVPLYSTEGLQIPAARVLVAKKEAKQLLRAWSALRPGQPPADTPAKRAEMVALLLEAAADAQLGTQRASTLALELLEVARRLHPKDPKVALAFARAAIASSERSRAAKALDSALRRSPKASELLLLRASLFERAGKPRAAISLLRRVHAPGYRRLAQKKIQRLSLHAPASSTQPDERALHVLPNPRDPNMGHGRISKAQDPGPGMTQGRSKHFQIIYNAGRRDLDAQARYEAKVLRLFEDAWQRLARLLSFQPSRVFDVVLYTQQEFSLHFGGMPNGDVLGFYAGKIRMNRSENVDGHYDSVVVHELTHAFLDDLCGTATRRLPTWFNEGFATWTEWELTRGGERALQKNRRFAQTRRVARGIGLEQMKSGSILTLGSNTTAGYLKGRAAISVLIGTGQGVHRFESICKAISAGQSFQTALRERYGQSIAEGLEDDANKVLTKTR